MLVLSRRAGEVIMIGDNIEIMVVGFDRNQVQLGFKAPRDVKILREEIVGEDPGKHDKSDRG